MVGSASGAGLYDAIYQHQNKPNLYLSVHQNADTLVVTRYETTPSEKFWYPFKEVNLVTSPTKLNIWEVFSGKLAGNTADLSGQSNYDWCTESMTLIFDSTGVAVEVTNISQRVAGQVYDVSCFAQFLRSPIRLIGSTIGLDRYLKVF